MANFVGMPMLESANVITRVSDPDGTLRREVSSAAMPLEQARIAAQRMLTPSVDAGVTVGQTVEVLVETSDERGIRQRTRVGITTRIV